MRNILTVTTAAFALCATTALAGKIDTTATVTDHYKTIIQQKPYNVEVCKDVTVHKNGSNAGEGALGGMIIGGVLGKVLGGNDKGAAADERERTGERIALNPGDYRLGQIS